MPLHLSWVVSQMLSASALFFYLFPAFHFTTEFTNSSRVSSDLSRRRVDSHSPAIWLDIGLRHRLQTWDLWACPGSVSLPYPFFSWPLRSGELFTRRQPCLPLIAHYSLLYPFGVFCFDLSLWNGPTSLPGEPWYISWLPEEGPVLLWELVLWVLLLMRLRRNKNMTSPKPFLNLQQNSAVLCSLQWSMLLVEGLMQSTPLRALYIVSDNTLDLHFSPHPASFSGLVSGRERTNLKIQLWFLC